MEVSGRGASSNHANEHWRDSQDGPTDQCQQCAESGKTVETAGFCLECKDYLCKDCILQHKAFRGTRRHVILEGTDMPQERPQHLTVEQCPQHNKPLELYCQSHDTFGCVLCFIDGHSSCSNIESITDICEDFETSDEIKELENVLQKQKLSFAACRRLIQQRHEENTESYEESIKEFKSFRSKIETMLDQLGDAVATHANQIRETNSKKLDNLTKQVTTLEKEIENLMYDMDGKRKMKMMTQLFIAVKRNSKKIDEMVRQLAKLKTEIKIQKYTFEAYPTMKQIINNKTSMGRVRFLTYEESSTTEIDAKSPDDKNNCLITSMVDISPSELVVTDGNNNCVKKIDVKRNVILQRLPVSCAPHDVAVLPGSKVAVILQSENKLQIISTDNGLTPSHSINVDRWCWGIDATNDRIVLSFSCPGKVQVLDINGTVLQSFTNDTYGIALYGCPIYLCMSGSSIYVSDCRKNTVTCISTDGAVKWTYTDQELKSPLGIAKRWDGSLYVSSRDSHNIYVLSSDGTKQAIISTSGFKLQKPRTICCSSSHNVIYISSQSDDPKQKNSIKTINESEL